MDAQGVEHWILFYLFPMRHLTRDQEGFYEIAFATDNQSWKALKPTAFGNFRFRGAPIRKKSDLIDSNLTLLHPFKQVRHQSARDVLPTDSRHVTRRRKSPS
jgi:hypothetical protein